MDAIEEAQEPTYSPKTEKEVKEKTLGDVDALMGMLSGFKQ